MTDIEVEKTTAEPIAAAAPGQPILATAIGVVDDALSTRGLEGHLVALVLHSLRSVAQGPWSESRWEQRVRALLTVESIEPNATFRTQDVALVGVRLALGDATHAQTFAVLAERELARLPMPPAVRVHDDERLLLGLAAGIGAAAPGALGKLVALLQERERSATYRQASLDIWADALARGSQRLGDDQAVRAYRLFSESTGGRPAVTEEDRIALFWLATRVLDSTWSPDNEALRVLDSAVADGRRAALVIAGSTELSPLDAALLVDGMTWSAATSVTTRTAVDYVLSVVDAFPACAHILANRQRKKPPFVITDEYDVQDLFYALVRPGVTDIVPEDTTPKLAGRGSRLDFTSKATRLGFELKHVKSHGHADSVRDEVLVDEATYQEHPYIDTVIVFIHDPGRFIAPAERPAFERDLSQSVTVQGRSVRYVVRVRG